MDTSRVNISYENDLEKLKRDLEEMTASRNEWFSIAYEDYDYLTNSHDSDCPMHDNVESDCKCRISDLLERHHQEYARMVGWDRTVLGNSVTPRPTATKIKHKI